MFDFILLFKHEEDSDEMPALVGKFPDVIDFLQDELQYIIPNSIPRKFDKSEIYMFNTASQYYYDYSFKVDSTEASIIIVSSHFHPSLFIDFLRSVDSSFDTVYTKQDSSSSTNNADLQKNNQFLPQDADTSIYCRFVYVHSLLSSWASNDDGDLVINYPFDSFIIKLSPDLSVYSPKFQFSMSNPNRVREVNHYKTLNRADVLKAEDDAISALHSWTDVFDVAPLVPHVEAVWATAIQNKGVFVVAQNASVASCSAISILSMLEPMKYAEPCMLFTQVGDPRFTIENLAPNALKNSKNDIKQFESKLNGNTQKVDDQNNGISIKSDLDQSKYRIVATTYESYVKLVEMISESASLSESDSIALLNKNFSAIITIKASSFKSTGNLKHIYTKKTKRILKKFLALMNLTLLNDPYFDLLEKEVDEDQFVHIWPKDDIVVASSLLLNYQNKNKYYFNSISNSTSIETLNLYDNANNNNNGNTNNKQEGNNDDNKNDDNNSNNDDNNSNNDDNNSNNDDKVNANKNSSTYCNVDSNNYYNTNSEQPSAAELIQFYRNIQKTETFRKWRHVREDRDQLRMGFLSITPKEAVENIPSERLEEAYEKVNMLINNHKKDEHYRIILSKNLSLIKKRIQKLKSI